MEVSEADSDQTISWTVVPNVVEEETVESGGPLMVAMQPGVDVPAVEVVVVTDDGGGGGSHLALQEVTVNPGHRNSGTDQVVAVAAVEEVKEEEEIVGAEESLVTAGDNAGVGSQALGDDAGSEGSASVSDDSDDSSASSSDYATTSSKRRRNRKKPKKREFAYRLQWRNKDMSEAMKAVQDKKMTIRGAAKKYGVPYSTLKDRVHGRVQHGTKPGVKTALSPEEEEDLVKYIKDMEGAGFQLRCIDVRDRAGEILNLNHGHNSPYKDNSPGHNWLAGFLKRHQGKHGLEFKKAMNRSVVPSMQKQKSMCRKFFDILGHCYKKHRMSSKPDRVYAVADIRVNVFQEATILVCASADGSVLPPFVIFKGQQRLKLTSARQAYPEAFFTNSYDGRVNEVVLLWWFRDHFLKKIASTSHRPCALLLSRPVHEVTFQVVQLAREERILLASIPTGISHVLHPLDERLSTTLENAISKRAMKWEEENQGMPFTQKIFAQILQKVWKKSLSSDSISEKFEENGIFPLNMSAISNDRILVASQALREREAMKSSPVNSSPPENNQFSGLSLLSALSSHEYASLEHLNMFGQGESPSDSQDKMYGKENGSVPSGRGKRGRGRKAKRRKLSYSQLVEEVEEEEEEEEEAVVEQVMEEATEENVVEIMGQDSMETETEVSHKMLLESLVELCHSSSESQVTDKKDDLPPKIHEELVAAKDNQDQINRAIESIGGEIVTQSDDSKTNFDIFPPKVEDGQEIVYEEVVQQEVFNQSDLQLVQEVVAQQNLVSQHELDLHNQGVLQEVVVSQDKVVTVPQPVSMDSSAHIEHRYSNTRDDRPNPTTPVRVVRVGRPAKTSRVTVTPVRPAATVVSPRPQVLQQPARSSKPRIQVIKPNQLQKIMQSGKKIQIIQIPRAAARSLLKPHAGQMQVTSVVPVQAEQMPVPAARSRQVIREAQVQAQEVVTQQPDLAHVTEIDEAQVQQLLYQLGHGQPAQVHQVTEYQEQEQVTEVPQEISVEYPDSQQQGIVETELLEEETPQEEYQIEHVQLVQDNGNIQNAEYQNVQFVQGEGLTSEGLGQLQHQVMQVVSGDGSTQEVIIPVNQIQGIGNATEYIEEQVVEEIILNE